MSSKPPESRDKSGDGPIFDSRRLHHDSDDIAPAAEVGARSVPNGPAFLRPFWRYYGGKWRASKTGAYPPPYHRTIIEPFAGAAGYSLVHGADRDVILVEKYATIAAIWRYLISVDVAEIRAIPEVDDVDDLPPWVPQPARWLVGFSMNSAGSTPRRTLSATASRDAGRGRDEMSKEPEEALIAVNGPRKPAATYQCDVDACGMRRTSTSGLRTLGTCKTCSTGWMRRVERP